ncbi:transcription factor bHLH155-like [Nymphaea colorata]|nr:transcription factor bHLH155-like [Nymphaea colorata]XP_031493884.1 transcription factor bHLH155-like [Nymphaea colorata]XP_031493886.1 transcription factor bHLH155-like [Nymphaea colorata]XP_031493887.1 transcription factor bHLH155-like [Nymphaea colorata]XP_031493888.1 transcription factor bHLH155-like [Nymphaea colorata]
MLGNTNFGGTMALGSQNLKDLMVNLQGLPRVSGFSTLKPDMENVQPLASLTQTFSGFRNGAKSPGNLLEYKASDMNSSQLISQLKSSVARSQAAVQGPGIQLSKVVSHSNPASGNCYQHSCPGISSSTSSLPSLDAIEHQLLSELAIQDQANLFCSTSPLITPLCALNKSADNGSLPVNNPQYVTDRAINGQTSVYYSMEAFCVPRNESEPTDSHGLRQKLTCETLSKRDMIHDQGAWNSFQLDLYDNVINSLNSDVSEALVAGSLSSGFVRMEAETAFGGIPVNNMATSSLSSSGTGRESSNSSSILCDDKKSMINMPLQSTTNGDLYDSLGLKFKRTHGLPFWDDSLLPARDGNPANFDASLSVSFPELEAHPLVNFDRSYLDMCSENLLDAVVAKVQCAPINRDSDDTLSKSTFTKANGTSVPNIQVQFEKQSPMRENADSPPLPDISDEKTAHYPSDGLPSMSQFSSWVEGSHSIGAEISLSEKKKIDEPVKTNRKRARPGESTRPRPKDRQQIQDRMKELREIVPNGAKCSIDALLDRTIKHMVFLQSVAKHADQLKHARAPKCGAGATWGFELGHQSVVSPIIVEDLSQPGQMLIEMLCEERGFFLEIADIIRGFGLTILKGVMEARNGKIWAHFIVEANRDVTRMDVFMSLVQLLDQTSKSSSNPCGLPSGVNGNGATIFPAFHESAVQPIIRVAERFQ